jgi:hypothetical protein
MSGMAASKESDSSTPGTPEDSEKNVNPLEPDSVPILNEQTNVKQPSRRDWMLTCIGLYLGALLYGKASTPFGNIAALTSDMGRA